MSAKIKIFAEDTAPYRAILIIEGGVSDVLECKLGTTAINYEDGNAKTRKGTFSGEIRITDIPIEYLSGINMIKRAKELEYGSIAEAELMLHKIHEIIPDGKVDIGPEMQKDITDRAAKSLTQATAPVENKPVQSAAPVKAVAKDTVSQPNVQQQPKTKEVPQAKKHMSKKERNRLKQQEKEQTKIKDPADLKKIINGAPKTEPISSVAKEATKPVVNPPKSTPVAKDTKPAEQAPVVKPLPEENVNEDKKYADTLGIILVNMKNYDKGYFIGHLYKNAKGNIEAIVIFTPKVKAMDNIALPMIFANEQTAKFVYDALTKHKVHSKMIGQCVVRPIEDLAESIRNTDAALIQNGVTYVDKLNTESYTMANAQ